MNEDELRPPYSAEQRPPYPPELIADLHAGVLDEALSARLWPLVKADPESAAHLAELDATRERLAALRDAPPTGAIPPEIVARIESALAEEESEPAPPSPRPATSRRWAVGVGVAAAVAAVFVMVVRGPAFESDGPADVPVAAEEDDELFEPSTLRTLIGQTDPGLLGSDARIRECLDANGFEGRSPIGSGTVRFRGEDAVLMVLGSQGSPALTALVVGPGCRAGDPATLARKTIG